MPFETNMTPQEWEWEAVSAAALEAYEAARRDEACHLWQRARELSMTLPAKDPRRAASTSNVGLALFIDGRMPESRAALEEAINLWDNGLAWIDNMEISFGARSSLFHLRMEQLHAASYATVRRASNRNLLKGSIALTKFNLALVQYHLDHDENADGLLKESIELRSTSFGTNDAQFANMLAVFAARLDALGRLDDADETSNRARHILARPPKTLHELWIAERPPKGCDQRRLLAAAYLTTSPHNRDVS